MTPVSQSGCAQRTIVVEFVGLPGAGKTTVARHLIQRLQQDDSGHWSIEQFGANRSAPAGTRGLPVRLLDALRMVAWFLFKQPLLALKLARFGLGAASPIRSRLVYGFKFIRVFARLEQDRADAGKMLILDQGLLQSTASIAVPGTRGVPKGMAAVAASSLARRVDGIVHVECEIATALARIGGRPSDTSRFDHWSSEKSQSELRGYSDVLAAVISAAGDTGIKILAISAELEPAANADRVAAWIHDELVGPGAPSEWAASRR